MKKTNIIGDGCYLIRPKLEVFPSSDKLKILVNEKRVLGFYRDTKWDKECIGSWFDLNNPEDIKTIKRDWNIFELNDKEKK